jgi:hypothetical protein
VQIPANHDLFRRRSNALKIPLELLAAEDRVVALVALQVASALRKDHILFYMIDEGLLLRRDLSARDSDHRQPWKQHPHWLSLVDVMNVRYGWKVDRPCGQMARMKSALPNVSIALLRSALESSWQADTAYLGVHQLGNPALGQCYPTSRVVQWFFPELEIASGEVDTGSGLEAHFWNVDPRCSPAKHVDLTWQQFPEGSTVVRVNVLDRNALNDRRSTIARCELLLERVLTKIREATAAS